ncbi:MAG TPA: response regulator, partial [Thiolapillus brandeum]|nr:response regulator [Thiolapillus brandeum]
PANADSGAFFHALHEVLNTGNIPTTTECTPKSKPLSNQHYRILVVDDNKTIQLLISTILEHAGHIIAQEYDGESALDRLFNEEFDAVVIDMQMPIMSGLETIKAYRYSEYGTTQHLPFIMLSANTNESARQEAKDAGADAFLAKPIEKNKLLQLIDELATGTATPVTNIGITKNKIEILSMPADTAPVIDMETLQALMSIESDANFLPNLMKHFFSDAQQAITNMEQGLSGRDMDAIRDAAHALQGSAGGIGALALCYECAQLSKTENSVLQKNGSKMIESIKNQKNKVRVFLEESAITASSKVHKFPGKH